MASMQVINSVPDIGWSVLVFHLLRYPVKLS